LEENALSKKIEEVMHSLGQKVSRPTFSKFWAT